MRNENRNAFRDSQEMKNFDLQNVYKDPRNPFEIGKTLLPPRQPLRSNRKILNINNLGVTSFKIGCYTQFLLKTIITINVTNSTQKLQITYVVAVAGVPHMMLLYDMLLSEVASSYRHHHD